MGLFVLRVGATEGRRDFGIFVRIAVGCSVGKEVEGSAVDGIRVGLKDGENVGNRVGL